MARLGIFIDGGYLNSLARDKFDIRPNFAKVRDQITGIVRDQTHEPLDLLRAYYYYCLPYQSDPATEEEKSRMSRQQRLFAAIRRLDNYTVREGRLAYRGQDDKGEPILQQKRIDLLLGLDFALLSGQNRMTHAAVVTGDSDLIPAVEVANQEGVTTWLFHGPHGTYATELWTVSDRRFEIDGAFMQSVALK